MVALLDQTSVANASTEIAPSNSESTHAFTFSYKPGTTVSMKYGREGMM